MNARSETQREYGEKSKAIVLKWIAYREADLTKREAEIRAMPPSAGTEKILARIALIRQAFLAVTKFQNASTWIDLAKTAYGNTAGDYETFVSNVGGYLKKSDWEYVNLAGVAI